MSDREKQEEEHGSQNRLGVRETNRQVVFLWRRIRQAGGLPSVREAGGESGTERLLSWLAGKFIHSPMAWETTEGC